MVDEKLALEPENSESKELMMRIARAGLLNFGKLSIIYLMRKLSCSESKAKEIMDEIISET